MDENPDLAFERGRYGNRRLMFLSTIVGTITYICLKHAVDRHIASVNSVLSNYNVKPKD